MSKWLRSGRFSVYESDPVTSWTRIATDVASGDVTPFTRQGRQYVIAQPLMSSAFNRLSKLAAHLLPERPETSLSVFEQVCRPLARVRRVKAQAYIP